MLRAGERVGDWIIEAPLGEGGMGAVYRVHSAMTQRLVAALKVMKPTAEPDARARFVREAEALSALRHPAVVRVMGFSEDAERGLLYLVMELAVGETLRARIARGAMDVPEALATFVPLAQGLDHAHSSGIFHRDLKPSNVVLCVDGTPRIVDFGIAAALEAEPLTTTGQLGTLPYLPPEVFRGERADPAGIDVYGFGLLLHEALTGQRSFAVDPASTPAAAAAAIGVRKLQSPSVELPEHFPARLRELVRAATGTDPKLRPTMRQMRETLESAVERRAGTGEAGRLVPVAGAAVVPDEATTRVPDPASVPLATGPSFGGTGSRGGGRRRADRTRVRLLTGAAVAAALLAAALFVSARRPGSEPVASGASRPPSTIAPGANRGSQAGTSARPSRPEPAAATSPSPGASTLPSVRPSPPAQPPAPAEASPRATPSPPPAEDQGPVERVDEEDALDPVPAEAPVQLSGRWDLAHQVESSNYAPYEGLRLGYRLNLVQAGNRVRGHGRKVSENGVPLPPNQRTPIEVVGHIENGELVLYFTEIGAARTSRGTIRWRLEAGGSDFHGRFASDAADSRGVSSGRRVP